MTLSLDFRLRRCIFEQYNNIIIKDNYFPTDIINIDIAVITATTIDGTDGHDEKNIRT